MPAHKKPDFKPKGSASVPVPKRTIDQVVGQEKSVKLLKKAAAQKRNVLLIGQPGTGKCLMPDTEILLGDGTLCTAEQLFSLVEQASTVATGNQKMVVLNASFLCPSVPSLVKGAHEKFWIKNSKLLRASRERFYGKVFRIRTASGREISVTPNHRLLSIDSKGFLLKQAKELTEKDFVAIPRKLHILNEKPLLNKPLPLPPENVFKKIKIPEKFDTSFAIWLGHLLAEGSFCRNQVRFTSADQHRRESFKELTLKLFGLRPYMRGMDVFINSVELLTYLREIFGLKIANARGKELPSVLMTAPKRTIKSFLARMFADDGCFSRNSIELVCSNKKLASQLVYLLLHFGIVARLKEKVDNKTHHTYYRIFIQGHFLKLFSKRVGFADARKTNLLNNYIAETSFNTNVDVVPFCGKLIRVARKSRGLSINDFEGFYSASISRYENNKKFPSQKALKEIVGILDKRLCLSTFDSLPTLKSLVHSNIFWDRVIEVTTSLFEGFVYDVEVDSASHLFVGGRGGIISHNSMLAQAMAEIMPVSKLHDVLVYPNQADQNNPKIRIVKAGAGKKILQKERLEARKQEDNMRLIGFLLPMGAFILSLVIWQMGWIPDVVFAALLLLDGLLMVAFGLGMQMRPKGTKLTPKLLIDNASKKIAPFIEATGARAGALLGDVRHDPLQSFVESSFVLCRDGVEGKISFEQLWQEMSAKYPKLIEKYENGYEAMVFPKEEAVFVYGVNDKKEIAKSRIYSMNRRPYDDEVVEISVGESKVTLTSEHSVITKKGNRDAEKLSKGDELIKIAKLELAKLFS